MTLLETLGDWDKATPISASDVPRYVYANIQRQFQRAGIDDITAAEWRRAPAELGAVYLATVGELGGGCYYRG